jgi:hypothetical protein
VHKYCQGGEANLVKAVLSTFTFQLLLPGLLLLLAVSFYLSSVFTGKSWAEVVP